MHTIKNKNYAEGLYEGRDPVTFMEKYVVEFRDTFARNYEANMAFGEGCLEIANNIERNYWASVREMAILTGTIGEGLNPRISCKESS